MKRIILLLFLMCFILQIKAHAQFVVKDQDPTPNTLIQINDEGDGGSLTLPPLLAVGSVAGKLFNFDGNLYWGADQLGFAGSAGGWTNNGPIIYNTTLTNKVGIGTYTPSANLHVSGDDGALFNGTFGSGTIPSEGTGTRMMWYPQKAAFRVGYTLNNEWNDGNIGDYSVAMGISTIASGFNSIAMGNNTTASSDYSTAIGNATTASGINATAMGASTTASGWNSTAMGYVTTAASLSSTAIGYNNVGGGSNDSWLLTDPLFEIGNGITMTPSNAMTVLKNGNVGIGIHNPSYKLDIDGGNILVRGDDGYTATGHTGTLYLGSVHSYIKAEYGYGVKIGAYAAADAISIKQLSGNVGIGTTTPNEKLEVEGKVRANTGFNVNGTNGISGTFNFYNDGTSGNVISITFNGGIITSVVQAP